jgi:hypothetical protein
VEDFGLKSVFNLPLSRVKLSAWQVMQNQRRIRRRWRWGGWIEILSSGNGGDMGES